MMHGLAARCSDPSQRVPVPRAKCANVLGVGMSAVCMKSALQAARALVASGRRGYICVTGVHGVMEAQRDPEFRRILNRSFLSVPDGMPTVWVGRLQGHRGMRRVYGPDFMFALCRHLVRHGYRHFLYGGNEGVAQRLAESLCSRIPGLRVVGTFTPPFRALNAEEESRFIAQIAACRPDIIWVGLSTPKQERFMAQYIDRLETRLMVGVGAAFDVHTGNIRDAPPWMKSCGLQWFHRLCQEPRRLWRRYAINVPAFALKAGLQVSGLTRYRIS